MFLWEGELFGLRHRDREVSPTGRGSRGELGTRGDREGQALALRWPGEIKSGAGDSPALLILLGCGCEEVILSASHSVFCPVDDVVVFFPVGSFLPLSDKVRG